MIYLVEDDGSIRELVLYTLNNSGLEARGFETPGAFWRALEQEIPQLIMLDIMLPEEDGLQILRKIRQGGPWKGIPVMMLTAKGTEFDKVVGLDAGADDYLAKPFGMMELISRVNALLRRANRPAQGAAEEIAEPSDLMVVGAIKLSPSARTVMADGREVNLTRKEFDLLRTLMENKGRVLTREQLLEQVWGVSFVGETRTVDMHVKTLRRKLAEAAPGSEEAVATVRGVGYRLKKSAS